MVRQQSKTSGADHTVMRELNRSLILDLLRDRSPISRATLAKTTMLAKPTVSAIVDDLIHAGLVTEIGVGKTTKGGGRPPILLEFNARSQYVVGVRIGVHRTVVVLADARGAEVARDSEPTPQGQPADQLKAVAAIVKKLLRGSGLAGDAVAAVGVCVPGLVDVPSGTCLLAPNLGWRDVPVRAQFSKALGGVPVFVHNATQAAAVAENVEGAGDGASEMVMLYIGSGIGAGILTDGRLFHGSGGIDGELGHCSVPGATGRCNCGKVGCLETVASGPSIVRTAVRLAKTERSLLSRKRSVTPEDVAAAARDGDDVALRVLADAGRTLGIALSWVVNLFNPEVVVIGGGLAEAGEPLLEPLRRAALEHALPQSAAQVSIRSSSLGKSAEVRGAVLLALQRSQTYYRVVFQG